MRELEKVKMLIYEATGLDLGYAYDDLVFSEHGIFIMQFVDENPRLLKCYFNEECNKGEKENMFSNLSSTAEKKSITIDYCGRFKMTPVEEKEEIELKFIEE